MKNYKNGLFAFKTELTRPHVITITLLSVGTVYTSFTFSIIRYKMLTLWDITHKESSRAQTNPCACSHSQISLTDSATDQTIEKTTVVYCQNVTDQTTVETTGPAVPKVPREGYDVFHLEFVDGSSKRKMLPYVFEAVTPQSEPISEYITTVNSTKHLEQQNQKKDEITHELNNYKKGWFKFKTGLIWPNIMAVALLHVGTVYTLLTVNIFQYKMLLLWAWITVGIGGFGVTGGAHRLWSHRSYKAKLPLRIILLACYLVAGQNSVYSWVRDHRVHHKYSETDADPHNSNRGFFFCHVGWQMMRKHPEVLRRGRQIDMSDILSDPLLQFAEKYFLILRLFAAWIIPIVIPVYCWNEEWYPTIMSQLFLRYPYTLNGTWSVNSLAHIWGYRSYNKSIRPAENRLVAFVSLGEGWHNYHHMFPWDYKVAELGNYRLNLTTMMIDGFAKIGWAYDLRVASKDLVREVVENRGDGSHPTWGRDEK